jgi:hypothetical protein
MASHAPSRPGTPQLRLASAEPRILGLMSPVTAAVLGAAGVIGGIAVLASGSALGGIVVLILGASLLALAIQAARRWPASRLPSMAASATETVGGRLGLARASAGAWSDATREKAQLEREIRELRDERRRKQADLGEAAYREEAGTMERLRRRVGEIDERIEGREEKIEAVSEQARERIDRERAATPQTQPFAVAEVPPPPSEDDDTRVSPTEERPAMSSDA